MMQNNNDDRLIDRNMAAETTAPLNTRFNA